MMYVIHFSLPYSILATCNQRIKMELHQHPLWTSDPIPFTAVMSYTLAVSSNMDTPK